jgi:hypothetical protein
VTALIHTLSACDWAVSPAFGPAQGVGAAVVGRELHEQAAPPAGLFDGHSTNAEPSPLPRSSSRTRTASICARSASPHDTPGTNVNCIVATSSPSRSATTKSCAGVGVDRFEGLVVGRRPVACAGARVQPRTARRRGATIAGTSASDARRSRADVLEDVSSVKLSSFGILARPCSMCPECRRGRAVESLSNCQSSLAQLDSPAHRPQPKDRGREQAEEGEEPQCLSVAERRGGKTGCKRAEWNDAPGDESDGGHDGRK